jgi:ABC-2 type transport system ATP-binding protein
MSFEINRGEVVALLGPNGSGKTTTVRILTGVVKPDAGSARVLGLDCATDGEDVRHRVGVMTENSGLDDRLTAFENISTHGYIRKMPRDIVDKRTNELLERFGLADRGRDRVGGFSTGQRKRVALARALLHEPDILLLDEPTSGLDPEATRDVLDLIANLASEHGRTVLFCTHFLYEAGRVCQRMVMLRYGEVLAFGAPAEIAASLGRNNLIKVRVAPQINLDLDKPILAKSIRNLDGVVAMQSTKGAVEIAATTDEVVPAVIAAFVADDVAIYSVASEPPSMEDVYFALSERHGGSADAWS